jgi:hypothetical protein
MANIQGLFSASLRTLEFHQNCEPAEAEHFSSGLFPLNGLVDTAQTGMEAHNSTNKIPSTERLWNSQELADYIGCSERELRNLRHAGLPTIKFRHLIRFEPEAVKSWLRENCSG